MYSSSNFSRSLESREDLLKTRTTTTTETTTTTNTPRVSGTVESSSTTQKRTRSNQEVGRFCRFPLVSHSACIVRSSTVIFKRNAVSFSLVRKRVRSNVCQG
ncbi:hypothetical protein ANTQUA_LOCUS423 [Anthophora quadrimaculata]